MLTEIYRKYLQQSGGCQFNGSVALLILQQLVVELANELFVFEDWYLC